MGLGFACQDLLREVDKSNPEGSSANPGEMTLLQNIVKTLYMALCQLCPSASGSLDTLTKDFPVSKDDTFDEDFVNIPDENGNLEEDAWGIAGLVLGLGNSVVALYRSGAYRSVLKIREMLISFVPQVHSSVQSPIFSSETTDVPLSVGSCLALPAVVAFCQRTELIDIDSDIAHRYGSLISALQSSNKSGTLYQNLMMACCIGAGSFLSCTVTDGMHSMRLDDVKYLLEILRDTYTHPCPASVHLGGMLGVVNAFGAGAGVLAHVCPQSAALVIDNEQMSITLLLVVNSLKGFLEINAPKDGFF